MDNKNQKNPDPVELFVKHLRAWDPENIDILTTNLLIMSFEQLCVGPHEPSVNPDFTVQLKEILTTQDIAKLPHIFKLDALKFSFRRGFSEFAKEVQLSS